MVDRNAPATKGDIADLGLKISSLDEKVTSLDEKVTSLDEKVTSLDEKVASLDEKVTSLDEKVTSLDQKVDSLDQRVGSLEQKFDRLEQKVDKLQIDMELHRSEVNHRFDDLIERMADGETRLLKAFYDFAQTNQKRLTLVEDNENALRSRLATLEDRVLNVEKRLNMPPAA